MNDTTHDDHRPLVRLVDPTSGSPAALPEERLRNLSGMTGLQRLGMFQGRLESGDPPCRLPVSTRQEIFLQIVTGTGELECDGQRVTLAGGDLLSLSHPDKEPTLRNTGAEPLVWFFGSR